ncbi:MAG: glucosamine-6-phosphate deaminase [Acidobacteria bacterium]|nr:MAG: glucosamine-6-phosphate deaminase [Acidobacteriota bacterium]
MRLHICTDRHAMSHAAAAHAAGIIRTAIETRGLARIVAATGTSQMDFLDRLASASHIDWRRVELFHLDEYVGIALDHPASFRRYLLDRFINRAGIVRYHLLDGERDAARVAEDVGRELAASAVDVAFAGIGENGHLAFNDPPADFETERPYIVVALDEACRRQQVGEGWFATFDDVPTHAISMSIRQILKSREIVCVVPEARKAAAVKACIEGEISPLAPASILRTHANTVLFLDRDSAVGLSSGTWKIDPE